ncbi:MAG: hypothetical protein LBI87_00285 [Candidatus Accumulibacter sp.]|nr:hypothetical protein [Accumulibacter sp.]
MSDTAIINLQWVDKGYGIKKFEQRLELDEPTLLEFGGLDENESERANTIAAKVWGWVCEHIEDIKDDVAEGVTKSLEEMRQKLEKHVPEDDYVSIRQQLKHIHFIQFFEFSSFTVNYFAWFNGARYRVYASYLYDGFSLEEAGILTMGGFHAPKTPDKSADPAKRKVK